MTNRKKLLLTLSMLLGLNTNALMAELTQTQLNATLGIVTNFILDDNTVYHHGIEYKIVTSPYTGRVWLDRNLGASQVCTSLDDALCYGDYYQWGRNYDGHQESNSSTTGTQAVDVNNAGNSFIWGSSDWASVDNNGSIRAANWSTTDGSSVCPVGFRVPTITELKEETLDNGVTNRDTAFTNFLKLPSAGERGDGTGILDFQGLWGNVWTSSVNGFYSYFVGFGSSYASGEYDNRAYGFTVRCLRN